MGRAPCCSKVGLHRGPWTAREDALLIKYIEAHGEGQWRSLPKKAGLLRCGKSCRLRWMNYLRPDIKRGNITPEEDDLIIRLHSLLGNRWSLIAGRLPGRTDNEIKNYWNTHLSKRLRSQGTDPNTHKTLVSSLDLGKHSKHSSKKRQGRNPIHNNNNNNNNYANKAGKIIQKMNQQVDKKLNSTNEEEKERTKIHLPKPVRVTSIISLTRNNNNSNGRFETTANCNFSTTTTSPSCQSQSQNHGRLAFDADNDLILDIPWLSSCNANIIHDDNDFDHLLMMGTCSDNADHDILQNHHHHHHHHIKATMPDNKNQQFEKLYEEYLQLIEADDDHRDNDGHPYYNNDNDDDDGDVAPLDSFTESFLI